MGLPLRSGIVFDTEEITCYYGRALLARRSRDV